MGQCHGLGGHRLRLNPCCLGQLSRQSLSSLLQVAHHSSASDSAIKQHSRHQLWWAARLVPDETDAAARLSINSTGGSGWRQQQQFTRGG